MLIRPRLNSIGWCFQFSIESKYLIITHSSILFIFVKMHKLGGVIDRQIQINWRRWKDLLTFWEQIRAECDKATKIISHHSGLMTNIGELTVSKRRLLMLLMSLSTETVHHGLFYKKQWLEVIFHIDSISYQLNKIKTIQEDAIVKQLRNR